jgi:hypothetical protein
MNKMDFEILALIDEIVLRKNLNAQEAYSSAQELLNTGMSKATLISLLKFALGEAA